MAINYILKINYFIVIILDKNKKYNKNKMAMFGIIRLHLFSKPLFQISE